MADDGWVEDLADLNLAETDNSSPSKLVVGHLHGGNTAASFTHSMINLTRFDTDGKRRMHLPNGMFGLIPVMSGPGRLERARNAIVQSFLDEWPAAELLAFIDSDMGFRWVWMELLCQVVESDPERFPIVGGLCFSQRPVGAGTAEAVKTAPYPTLYMAGVNPETGLMGFNPIYEYPRDELVQVDGTGAAFVVIHRSILEKMRTEQGDAWFNPVTVKDNEGRPSSFGEDLSFCIRARQAGAVVHVHTAAKTSHLKETWLDEDEYDSRRRPAWKPLVVVVPVKDQLELTQSLTSQLLEQGGYTDLVIFDHASETPEMREWLDARPDVRKVSAELGIHDMWNLGIEEAVKRHGGHADVLFLNNDLRLGEEFCRRMSSALHSDPQLVAVSANYDGRDGEGVVPVRGICAGRYDGSGGLAGFAFAVRADFLEDYRFPEDMKWFYGDNDLCASAEQAGAWYGIAADAEVEHLDGGGATFAERGLELEALYEPDRKAFEAKWDVQVVPAS